MRICTWIKVKLQETEEPACGYQKSEKETEKNLNTEMKLRRHLQ